MTNGSKRWRFFVLINARANGNIFRVKKSHISLSGVFFKQPVLYETYHMSSCYLVKVIFGLSTEWPCGHARQEQKLGFSWEAGNDKNGVETETRALVTYMSSNEWF